MSCGPLCPAPEEKWENQETPFHTPYSTLLSSALLYPSLFYYTFTLPLLSSSLLFPVQLYSTLLCSSLFYFILFGSGLQSHSYPTDTIVLSVHVYLWFLPLHRPKPLLRDFFQKWKQENCKTMLAWEKSYTKAWRSWKPNLLLRDFHSERIWKTEKTKPICRTSVKHDNGGAEQRSYSEQFLWFRGMEELEPNLLKLETRIVSYKQYEAYDYQVCVCVTSE